MNKRQKMAVKKMTDEEKEDLRIERDALPIETHIKVLECLPSNIDYMELRILRNHMEFALRDTLSILSQQMDASFVAKSSERVASRYRDINDTLERYRLNVLTEVEDLCEVLKGIHNYVQEKKKEGLFEEDRNIVEEEDKLEEKNENT